MMGTQNDEKMDFPPMATIMQNSDMRRFEADPTDAVRVVRGVGCNFKKMFGRWAILDGRTALRTSQ